MNEFRLRTRFTLTNLEARDVPAVVAMPQTDLVGPILLNAPASVAKAQTIGDRMAAYLNARVGSRVGGGECAHVASEALRASGGKFISIGADAPTSGDYDWGALVKKFEYKNNRVQTSNTSALKVGDILQFRNVRLANGTTFTHHTSVVAAVNSAGNVTMVYEQNLNKGTASADRNVRLRTLDLSQMRAGYVMAYRAEARVNTPGRFEFSVVNKTNASRNVQVKFGSTTAGTLALTTNNTQSSYKTVWYSWSSGAAPKLFVGTSSVTVANAGAFEVYTMTNGNFAIRAI